MGLYAQATGVILFFAFIGFIFLSGKGWRWHHITALTLIFLSSIFFAVMAAGSLKTHTTWLKKYEDVAKQLEAEQQKTHELQFGPLSLEAEKADSVRRLQNELERVVVDRGRVWRDVQLVNVNLQEKLIAFKFADRVVAGVDTAPALHRLTPNSIIYGFKEKETPAGGKVPAFFMGIFVVQQVPDGTSVIVTPSPSLPLDPMQSGEVKPDGVTWAFYEIMPVDSHYKFADVAEADLRTMLMPGGWHGRPAMAPAPKYEETITQYLRDGKEANDADPPERVWAVVELTQPWKVDVDAPAAAMQLPTRNFDIAGLALTPLLRQGAPCEFKPGDLIELDSEAAQKLIDQGIAKPKGKIYRRPLHDYAYDFIEITRNTRVLAEEAKLMTKANDTVQQAIDKTNKEITFREGEKTNLGEDLQHVKQEADAMKQYLATLKSQYDGVVANLRALYAENLELVDRLRRIEQAIVNAVQQQLADANTRP